MIFDGSYGIDPTIGYELEAACGDKEEKKTTDEDEKKAVEEAFSILVEALAPPRFGADPTPDHIADNIEFKLKAINSPYLKDVESKPSSPLHTPVSGFKRLLQAAMALTAKKEKSAAVGGHYSYMLNIQREISDIYKEINKLFRNDAAVKTYFAQTTVTTVEYQGINIKEKKTGKLYKYQIIPNEIPLVEILNAVINYGIQGKNNDYYKLKNYKSAVYDWLHKYYWYIIDCSPEASMGASVRIPMDEHLCDLRDYTNNIYAVLYNLTNYLTQNSQFLLIIQKNYVEAERKVGHDKEAMKIIDDIYTEILRYAQGIIDFNFTAHEVLAELMEKYYGEIKRIYDEIKAKTGKLA